VSRRGADPPVGFERSDAFASRRGSRGDRTGDRAGELGRAGISDLEIGYSARNAAERDRLEEALCAFELVETTAEHVRRAKQVQRMLAAKHQRGRKVPDLLIAAAAELCGLTVLHYDSDFDRIASVTGQSCEWVVPAGSVD
jgi:predicted nucleic acid-binding protein